MQECIQYIRVSSEEQSKGGSLGAQEREGQKYRERQNLKLVVMFTDVETAKSAGREQFSRMTEFLKKQKKPVVLVVEKTDRLYRNYGDMELLKALVKAKGHEIHLYKENVVLNRQTDSKTWFFHYINVGMATNYVENLSEEIIKGRNEKLLNGGYPHRAPFGYKNDKNTKSILVDDNAAPFVREAFRLFGTGLYSLERLSKALYESGFSYKPQIPLMDKATLSKMLKNPFYIGEMKIKGEIFPGKHEPLIDMTTWLAAQQAFRKDNKPLTYNRQEFKYAHILTCHECGASYVGEEKKGGRYVYYRCASRKKGCSQGYIAEGKLDKHFDRFIESLILSPEIREAILQAAQDIESDSSADLEIAKTQAEIKRYKTNLKQALQEKIDGNIDTDLYREISADYQNTIRQLEARLSKIVKEDIDFYRLANMLVDLPRTLSECWKKAKNSQKIELLNFVSANFFIEAEKMRYELKEPFSLIGKKALCEAWWSIGDSNS
ncbi:recombinase family protein [Vampirovibrio sp.]|uniref:recombinase family protein n=1 Tax=Vampirovibrio sp. TaxID=2717857 RepID=UPI0035946739